MVRILQRVFAIGSMLIWTVSLHRFLVPRLFLPLYAISLSCPDLLILHCMNISPSSSSAVLHFLIFCTCSSLLTAMPYYNPAAPAPLACICMSLSCSHLLSVIKTCISPFAISCHPASFFSAPNDFVPSFSESAGIDESLWSSVIQTLAAQGHKQNTPWNARVSWVGFKSAAGIGSFL